MKESYGRRKLPPSATAASAPRPRLAAVDEPLAVLAGYFRRKTRVPDAEVVRLTAEARAGGSRWDAIAAACGVQADEDTTAIVSRPSGRIPTTGAGLLFRAAQYSAHQLTGGSMTYPPLTWICPGCKRQVTDRAATGRPVHVEHGHAAGCARLAGDQAADDEARRGWLPGLVVHSEPARGPVQRHWLLNPMRDDCPRCGWHGYFHGYHHEVATIDGDWAAAVCGDCYADLDPDITVTVRFFSARSFGGEPAFAAIRQRARSDYDFPDRGQAITWELSWQFTSMLVEEAHGGADEDIAEIGRPEAEQIAAGFAASYWPPDAARLPWVTAAYPE
jgi:hypothetical protein